MEINERFNEHGVYVAEGWTDSEGGNSGQEDETKTDDPEEDPHGMLFRDVEQLRREVEDLSRDALLVDLNDVSPEMLDAAEDAEDLVDEDEQEDNSNHAPQRPNYPKKYSLYLTRDNNGNHGIGNAHTGKHVIFLDISESDLNLGFNIDPETGLEYPEDSGINDEEGDSTGKYCQDIIVGDSGETLAAYHLEHDNGVKIAGGQFYNPFVKNACNQKTYQKLFKKANLLALMLETILTHDLNGCANIIDYHRAHATVLNLLQHLTNLAETIIQKMNMVDQHPVRIELFYEVGENPERKYEPCSFGMNGSYCGLPFYPGPKFSYANESFITRCIKAVRQAEYYKMVRDELMDSINLLRQFWLQLRQVPEGGRLKILDENKAVRGGIVIALEIILACIDRANFEPKNLKQFTNKKKLNPLQVPPNAWVRLKNNDPSIFNQIFGFDSSRVVHRRHMTRSHLNSRQNRGYEFKNARLSVTKELQAKVRDPISAQIATGLIDRVLFLYSKGVEANTRIANKPISLFFSLDSADMPGEDQLPRVESLVHSVAKCAYDCLRRENSQIVSALSYGNKSGKASISPTQVPYDEDGANRLKHQFINRECPIQLATVEVMQSGKIAFKRSEHHSGYCLDSAGIFFLILDFHLDFQF